MGSNFKTKAYASRPVTAGRLAVSLIFVLGFMASQIAAAAHQHEHEGLVPESCGVCVQLDVFESAALSERAGHASFVSQECPTPDSRYAAAPAFRVSYSSRAPPQN